MLIVLNCTVVTQYENRSWIPWEHTEAYTEFISN